MMRWSAASFTGKSTSDRIFAGIEGRSIKRVYVYHFCLARRVCPSIIEFHAWNLIHEAPKILVCNSCFAFWALLLKVLLGRLWQLGTFVCDLVAQRNPTESNGERTRPCASNSKTRSIGLLHLCERRARQAEVRACRLARSPCGQLAYTPACVPATVTHHSRQAYI